MLYSEHGLSFGINRIFYKFYLKIKIVGKLKHADYEVMVPMLEDAIKDVREPEIRTLVDVTEFEGWELRAAWDDLKLGVKHNREFKKIALLGNKNWEKVAATVSNWFISGESKYFEDKQEALNWLES